jgi:adenylate cyclase
VFFGDPDDQPDHALRCVRCAIDMQAEVRRMNAEWERQGQPPVRIRIGVHTGPVVVGNMGARGRLSYTALGAAVNLTQRLESAAPPGGILISAATASRLAGSIPLGTPRAVEVKGLDAPVEVRDVLGDENAQVTR